MMILFLIYNYQAPRYTTTQVDTEGNLGEMTAFAESNNQIYYYNDSVIYTLQGHQSQEIAAGTGVEDFYMFNNGSLLVFQKQNALDVYSNGVFRYTIPIDAKEVTAYENRLFVVSTQRILSIITYSQTDFTIIDTLPLVHDIQMVNDTLYMTFGSYILKEVQPTGVLNITPVFNWNETDTTFETFHYSETITSFHVDTDGDVLLTNGTVVKKMSTGNSMLYTTTFEEPVLDMNSIKMFGISYDLIQHNNSLSISYFDQAFLMKTYQIPEMQHLFVTENEIFVITTDSTMKFFILPGMVNIDNILQGIIAIIMINFLLQAARFAIKKENPLEFLNFYLREMKLYWNAKDILHDKILKQLSLIIQEQYDLDKKLLKEELVFDTGLISYGLKGDIRLFLRPWILRGKIIHLNSVEMMNALASSLEVKKLPPVTIRLTGEINSQLDIMERICNFGQDISLDLSNCNMSNDDLQHLVESHSINQLSNLDLSNNQLQGDLVLHDKLSQLKRLSLSNNPITAIEIDSSFETEVLDLTSTEIDSKAISRLIDAVADETRIQLDNDISLVSTIESKSHELYFIQRRNRIDMEVAVLH